MDTFVYEYLREDPQLPVLVAAIRVHEHLAVASSERLAARCIQTASMSGWTSGTRITPHRRTSSALSQFESGIPALNSVS